MSCHTIRNRVCFVDLDGVLVDFVGGALCYHNQKLNPLEVRWDFPSQIGFAGREEAFWSGLGRDFWANLPWTTEGVDLLHRLEALYGQRNICLLTSPCYTPGCAEGKLDWVRHHLPAYKKQVLVGPCKDLVAGPDKLLVDDHDANVLAFRGRGGKAVLVPRPWNSCRDLVNEQGHINVDGLIAEVLNHE